MNVKDKRKTYRVHTLGCFSSKPNLPALAGSGWVDDGSHIVYVNGNYKGDDTVGRLMHDFGCKEAKDMYYPELAKGVKHFKEEGGRERMCEAVEKYAENVRLNSLLESVRKLMANMKLGAEQAMNVLEVNEHDREILQKRL